MLNILFVSSRFRSGGVEKKINRLALGFIYLNINCTLILNEDGSAYIDEQVKKNSKICINTNHNKFIECINNTLSSEYYDIIFCFRSIDYSNIINNFYKKAYIYLLNGDYISTKLDPLKNGIFKSLKLKYRIAKTWRKANGIITSSPNIADDWKSIGSIDSNTIYSPVPPVIGNDVLQLSQEKADHPWLSDKNFPVVLGVGRLESSKRFDIFIEALALANQSNYIRGIILGQGSDYQSLIDLIHYHGLQDRIDLPGYVQNPYSWMRKSDVLLLTSQIEPLGWVLIESLFVGTPFIASMTPPGPKSIQKSTNSGIIVNNDTPHEFANSIQELLNSDIDAHSLHQSAKKYDITSSAREHLDIINKLLDSN